MPRACIHARNVSKELLFRGCLIYNTVHLTLHIRAELSYPVSATRQSGYSREYKRQCSRKDRHSALEAYLLSPKVEARRMNASMLEQVSHRQLYIAPEQLHVQPTSIYIECSSFCKHTFNCSALTPTSLCIERGVCLRISAGNGLRGRSAPCVCGCGIQQSKGSGRHPWSGTIASEQIHLVSVWSAYPATVGINTHHS
jgi:hypothetical protein